MALRIMGLVRACRDAMTNGLAATPVSNFDAALWPISRQVAVGATDRGATQVGRIVKDTDPPSCHHRGGGQAQYAARVGIADADREKSDSSGIKRIADDLDARVREKRRRQLAHNRKSSVLLIGALETRLGRKRRSWRRPGQTRIISSMKLPYVHDLMLLLGSVRLHLDQLSYSSNDIAVSSVIIVAISAGATIGVSSVMTISAGATIAAISS